MPSPKPLLTIAIPTFNRSHCLVELLTYLAPQLKNAPAVELIISDNGSTDSTRKVIDSFRTSGLDLIYFCNDVNLGMDRNFLQCFERAQGKYVWLIGDDDVLVPGGLQKVLNVLTGGEYDLVYVTSYPFKETYSAITSSIAPLPEVISSPQQFVDRVHIALTFLSGNIANKDRVLSLDHPAFSSLDGTKLVQLGWIYTLLRRFKSGVVIHEPLIAARAENTGGYAVFTVFGVSLRRITQEWLVDPVLVRVMLKSTIHHFLPWFLLTTKSGRESFDREDPHAALLSAYGDVVQYWLFDYPIIKLPRVLAKLWFFLGKVLLKIDHSIGSPLFG